MDETDKDARIEALEAEVAALKARLVGASVNYRRCAQQLAALTSALLSASEAE